MLTDEDLEIIRAIIREELNKQYQGIVIPDIEPFRSLPNTSPPQQS